MNLTNFLNNSIFNETYLASDFPTKFNLDISQEFQKVKNLYKDLDNKTAEDDLEDKLISPILKILGYTTESQKSYNSAGDGFRPDFSLFEDKKKSELLLICESKKWNIKLDTGKVNQKNPHFQVTSYMQKLKLDFSFLTNGKFWRLYDNRKVVAEKRFYEIDLEWIIKNGDILDFNYFFYMFRKENFLENEIKVVTKESEEFSLLVEKDLQSVIYGTNLNDSIFEKIGEVIFRKEKNLDLVFEKSIYFTFRTLFILFFEDRNQDILKNHRGYRNLSFKNIFSEEIKLSNDYNIIYEQFVKLFRTLDKGSPPHRIPLFNGGLFALDKILDDETLFGDLELNNIFQKLRYFKDSQFKRDFKNLSVINLGSIYEGLLDYYFRIENEEIIYVEFQNEKKEPQYLDSYDFHNLKEKEIAKSKIYKAKQLFLSNSNNTRKESASYYTPESVSSLMVKEAIDLELSKGKSIFDIRIIDNACGSGHFLVEALNYLTKKGLEILEKENSEVIKILEQEKQDILENLKKYRIENIEITDIQVLKRMVLKKSIFGTDLNNFAVEISKLALWIDSFIFGTPLSLIEHHIKQGNSLIGSTVKEFEAYLKDVNSSSLFFVNLADDFQKLKTVSAKISEIKDRNEDEVLESKKLFKNIQPEIKQLNIYLNFLTTRKIKEIEGEKDFGGSSDIETELKNHNSETVKEILKYAKKYSFFNYEVEFSEIFYQNSESGFDIVVGNPPWEKVVFNENDFFPKFKRDYRTLKHSEKAKVRKEKMEIEEVSKLYDETKSMFQITNSYLSAHYPKNAGAGDNNLFRFFVEKNLSILKKDANLTYILPSALFQDDGSIKLRTYILKDFYLNFFYAFENSLPVFPDVHRSYKFAIIQIETKTEKRENQIIKTLFYQKDPAKLETPIKYKVSDIFTISPHHQNLLELRTSQDLEITRKAYQKFKQLDSAYFDVRNELNITSDKKIFREENENGLVPLYEGKMVFQFNPEFKEAQYFLDLDEFDNHILSKEISRLVSDIFEALPEQSQLKKGKIQSVLKFLDLEKKDDLAKFVRFDRNFFRIVIRDIARNTDSRTAIASLIHKNIGIGNTLHSEIPKKYILQNGKIVILENSLNKKLFLISVLNSIVFDFLARQIIQINVNKTYLIRLPIPQPTEIELETDEVLQKIILNTKKITSFYSDKFEFDVGKPKNLKAKNMLEIENNILIAKIYGIDKSEMEYILSTFKVLNKNRKPFVESLKSKFL